MRNGLGFLRNQNLDLDQHQACSGSQDLHEELRCCLLRVNTPTSAPAAGVCETRNLEAGSPGFSGATDTMKAPPLRAERCGGGACGADDTSLHTHEAACR